MVRVRRIEGLLWEIMIFKMQPIHGTLAVRMEPYSYPSKEHYHGHKQGQGWWTLLLNRYAAWLRNFLTCPNS
jgi:hypothetical protein